MAVVADQWSKPTLCVITELYMNHEQHKLIHDLIIVINVHMLFSNHLCISTDNLLQMSLYMTLQSVEFIVMVRVLRFCYILICLQVRLLSDNAGNLDDYMILERWACDLSLTHWKVQWKRLLIMASYSWMKRIFSTSFLICSKNDWFDEYLTYIFTK